MTDFPSHSSSVIPTASLMVKYAATTRSALYHFATNLGFFFLSIGCLYLFRNNGFFIGLPFLTLSMVRTFIILHDCGHSSFSPSRRLNWWVGTFHGVLLGMPFSWSSHHYIHHLVSGNKSNGNRWSETIQFSVQEYKGLPSYSKQLYRMLREPIVFFSCLPLVQLLVEYRLSFFFHRGYNYPSREALGDWLVHHIGLGGWMFLLWNMGVLKLYMMCVYIQSVIVFILFHNQHTFNPAYVIDSSTLNNKWSMYNAAMKGASHIEIPPWLQWFTMGIEYHHLHHLMTRIPGYRLSECHRYIQKHYPECLLNVVHLSMMDLWRNLQLVLYCTERKRFVTFKEV